jgi:hypothetical protein
MPVVILLLYFLGFALSTSLIAGLKGRSRKLWFVLGALLGPFALFVSLFLSPENYKPNLSEYTKETNPVDSGNSTQSPISRIPARVKGGEISLRKLWRREGNLCIPTVVFVLFHECIGMSNVTIFLGCIALISAVPLAINSAILTGVLAYQRGRDVTTWRILGFIAPALFIPLILIMGESLPEIRGEWRCRICDYPTMGPHPGHDGGAFCARCNNFVPIYFAREDNGILPNGSYITSGGVS